MRLLILFNSLIFGFLMATSARAEVLLLDTLSDATGSSTSRPAHGITMTTVENRHGTPGSTSVQVGEPPITRWVYPEFTVYFEFDKVIHSVMHRPNSRPGTP